jgi:hypothetical protein
MGSTLSMKTNALSWLIEDVGCTKGIPSEKIIVPLITPRTANAKSTV